MLIEEPSVPRARHARGRLPAALPMLAAFQQLALARMNACCVLHAKPRRPATPPLR